ncbi:hypothetical protein AVEN_131210-1 [Araneus ventricosus]|uniref:Uncharacterized protein n=1 Tax=Araneus ventricosus TaxID=182803 RepID=A0A4Y2H8R4_ARAVE|nr:hypothetical protein AVEN_131210-1 [Araneus ventricosus]
MDCTRQILKHEGCSRKNSWGKLDPQIKHRRILYSTVSERMFLDDSAAWMPNLTSLQMKISPDDPKDVSVIHDQIQPHNRTAELQTITGISPLRTRTEHDVVSVCVATVRIKYFLGKLFFQKSSKPDIII